MGADSNIGWTDSTFNPWIGCTEVSAACDFCYARDLAEKKGWAKWGAKNPRHRTAESTWHQPVVWNKKAMAAGVRQKVFCASLADVFDNEVPQSWRDDLWRHVKPLRSLDILLLTKRPQNAGGMIPAHWRGSRWPRNMWLGTTVENQQEADRRIPHLLKHFTSIHFLSVEPMLGPIDITEWLWGKKDAECDDCPRDIDCDCGIETRKKNDLPAIDWVICGGESGTKRRPFDLAWAEDLRKQCADSNVPFFFKQDIAFKPGQRGRASDALWACKQFPEIEP